MIKIPIHHLSVNKCWRGRRFKTKLYTEYEEDVFSLLPHLTIPEGKLHLTIDWGFSNRGNDIDNGLKPFIDILTKAYEFNDNRIYKITVTKNIVPTGEEYISFDIKKH